MIKTIDEKVVEYNEAKQALIDSENALPNIESAEAVVLAEKIARAEFLLYEGFVTPESHQARIAVLSNAIPESIKAEQDKADLNLGRMTRLREEIITEDTTKDPEAIKVEEIIK